MSNIDFTNFLNSMLSSITTAQVLTVLAAVVGVGMAFLLMWFGVKKITAQFTEMVAFGKWALTGKPEAWDKYDDIVSAREAGMSVKDYKKWVSEDLGIHSTPYYDKPIEPVEPSGKPMTKEERKEFNDYYSTHDSYGHKLGYDKRNYNNYYKKNNYKKKYYYDSYGKKYKKNNYKKKYTSKDWTIKNFDVNSLW